MELVLEEPVAQEEQEVVAPPQLPLLRQRQQVRPLEVQPGQLPERLRAPLPRDPAAQAVLVRVVRVEVRVARLQVGLVVRVPHHRGAEHHRRNQHHLVVLPGVRVLLRQAMVQPISLQI